MSRDRGCHGLSQSITERGFEVKMVGAAGFDAPVGREPEQRRRTAASSARQPPSKYPPQERRSRRNKSPAAASFTCHAAERDSPYFEGDKAGRVTTTPSARVLLNCQKSHKMLVINAVYSQLRTRVLTAIFALLILRPQKSPPK